jgi:tetratricopeptide (TPR) repeat protein
MTSSSAFWESVSENCECCITLIIISVIANRIIPIVLAGVAIVQMNLIALAAEPSSDKKGSPNYLLQNADRDFIAGYYQSARDFYSQYLHAGSKPDPEVITHMAMCDFWLGLNDVSAREFNRVSKLEGQSLACYLARIDAHIVMLEYDRSLEASRECCQHFPNEWKGYWRLGFLHNKYCEYPEAIDAYSKAIELFPKTSTDSKATFEELSGHPKLSRLFALRAQCFYRVGKYTDSIADCTKFIELDPSSPTGYESRAEAFLHLQKFADALNDLKKAAALDTPRARTFKQLGFCQLQIGQNEDAAANFSQAIKIFPRYAEAYHLRAKALRSLGKAKDAEEDEKTAKRFGFTPASSA